MANEKYLAAQKHKEDALVWLERLHKDPLPVQYGENIKWFREKVALGRFELLELGTSEKKLEELRIQKHLNSAIQTLGFMGNDPQPEGSHLQEMRKAQLREDMLLGNFNEDFLRKVCDQRRKNDPLNPNKSRKLPEMPPKGTPQYEAVVVRVLNDKTILMKCLVELRKVDISADKYDHIMRYFRVAMRGGFKEEELGGGSFFDLRDIGTSRKELWELNPRNKDKKLPE